MKRCRSGIGAPCQGNAIWSAGVSPWLCTRKRCGFHLDLPYFNEDGTETGRWPALLAVVSGMDGQPVTLHRTYLTAEGVKAPAGEAKKLMAYPSDCALAGGAIRLFPAQPILGVAEGIETALAVHQATGLPVWPAVSATLLAQFQSPAGVHDWRNGGGPRDWSCGFCCRPI